MDLHKLSRSSLIPISVVCVVGMLLFLSSPPITPTFVFFETFSKPPFFFFPLDSMDFNEDDWIVKSNHDIVDVRIVTSTLGPTVEVNRETHEDRVAEALEGVVVEGERREWRTER
eukprot:CAMPEP_0118657166 /NCGR_PEP_ID=MMETSP0785-20121206/13873_1 /TAXON_ID=91992 /ORGANISM="Bolidomonas pacifica, Strain CCMP 1866" /LENGTH=114 /DNA_ID=CAMNT_0006550065 /DNA_START=521 /DNA_END=865 /DNA_ORIENTATION=-